MSPAMVTAIAYLLSEALVSGIKLSELLAKAKENPDMTDEQWASIQSEVKAAEALWDAS